MILIWTEQMKWICWLSFSFSSQWLVTCWMVVNAWVFECGLVHVKIHPLSCVRCHVASSQGLSMTHSAKHNTGRLHHRHWHRVIQISNWLNMSFNPNITSSSAKMVSRFALLLNHLALWIVLGIVACKCHMLQSLSDGALPADVRL